MWFLTQPVKPETALQVTASAADAKKSKLRQASPLSSSQLQLQSRDDDDTDDLRADEEVSKIVAWALEDVKVTRDDDESFEEAIELVSSEERMDDNSTNGMSEDPTVISNVETMEGVTVALVLKPAAGAVPEEDQNGDDEKVESRDPPGGISKNEEELKTKAGVWIDMMEPEEPKSEEPRENNAAEPQDMTTSKHSDDNGYDEIGSPLFCISDVESSAAAKAGGSDAEEIAKHSGMVHLEEQDANKTENDSKLEVIDIHEEESQGDIEIEIINVEECVENLEPTIIHVVDDEDVDIKQVLEEQNSSTHSVLSDHSSASVTTTARIDALRLRLRRMEKKHEEYVAANHKLSEVRFQLLESMITEKSVDLDETKKQLNEAELELKAQAKHHAEIIAEHNEQHLMLLERVAQIEQRLTRRDPTSESTVAMPLVAKDDPMSSTETLCTTASSFEKMPPQNTHISEEVLAKLVQTEVERILSERDEQLESLQQKAESQGKQLSQLMTTKLDVDRVFEQQEKLQEIWDENFQLLIRHENERDEALHSLETANVMIQEGYEKVVAQLKTLQASGDPSEIDAESCTGSTASSSAEKMASRRASIQGINSDLTEKASNLQIMKLGKLLNEEEYYNDTSSSNYLEKRDNELQESVMRECQQMMERETEHLMKTWGAHFQELATHVQNDLDKQREIIAETRTSTFEHVDAESETRAAVWNAQYNQLVKQAKQHTQQILDIKEDQERAILIIVETIVNLKMKVDGLSEEMMVKPTASTEDEASKSNTVPTLQQMIDEKTTQLESRMGTFNNELQMVKADLKNVHCTTAHIIQDHEAMQSVVDQTVKLFNAKMETNVDVWTLQLGDLQSEIEDYVQRNFGRKRDQEKLKEKMEIIFKKLDSTYVDLIKVLNRQAAELRAAQEAQVYLFQMKEENKVIQSLLEKAAHKWDATHIDLCKVVEGQAAELKAARDKQKAQPQQQHIAKKKSRTSNIKATTLKSTTEDKKTLLSCIKCEDLPLGSLNSKELSKRYLLPPLHSRSRSSTPPTQKKVTFDESSSSAHENKPTPKAALRRSPLPKLRMIATRQAVEYYDLTDFEPKRDLEPE